MLIPIGLDVPFDRRPFFNWLMIVVIIVIFGFQVTAIRENPNYAFDGFLLDGFDPGGFFAHTWLHGGPIDLIVNLIFLWLFGNAVCAKIGNLLYVPVYIFLGLVAAITFNIVSDGVALGASGAINGIAGMFLVFYPANDVNMMMATRFYRSWEFTVPSIVMVVIWLVADAYVVALGIGIVSYTAHLVAFAMGVLTAVLLLKFRVVEMDKYEESLLDVLGISVGKTASGDWQHVEPSGPREEAIRRAVEDRESADQECYYQSSQEAKEKGRFAYQRRGFEDDAIEVEPVDDGYIHFLCECGNTLKVPDSYAGKNGKCPKCKKRVRVPG